MDKGGCDKAKRHISDCCYITLRAIIATISLCLIAVTVHCCPKFRSKYGQLRLMQTETDVNECSISVFPVN